MTRVEQSSPFGPGNSVAPQGNMSAAKLLGKRTHQIPGRLSVSELFFEVPKDYSNHQNGRLRLFARSVERFEKPVDASKKEVKQLPWCTHHPPKRADALLTYDLSSPLSPRRARPAM